jgi:transposase InsO family protein
MSMARVVITAVVAEGRSKSAVARDYGVSRRWVQVLVARYLAGGETAFEPRSRRPHTNPRQTSQPVEDAIVDWRKRLTGAGHDAGAETIAWHLRQQTGSAPSVATIWRILSRRGFVIPQPHKRPRSSWRRFAAELPNELWQADITHWPLADGSDAEILNIVDDHSGCWPAPRPGGLQGRRHRGRPAHRDGQIRPARADAHRQRCGLHRPVPRPRLGRPRTRTHRARDRAQPLPPLPPADLRQGRALPPDPQKWLARQDPATTIGGLQAQLEEFTACYNTRRPHRAIGRRTPLAAWNARPRAIPARQGIRISEHFRVRRDRVDPNGKLTLRHNSRLHHIGAGRRWAGTKVLILARDLELRIITQDGGELIRQLTLDPTRNYQPQAPMV